MKSIYYSIIILSILIFSASCSNQEYDDYKEFAEGGEIIYPEKMDSVKAFAGHDRVKISGIVDADPKISEFRVFWNNKTDSVSVPVTRGPGVDTLEVTIVDIEENIYNFEVRTYDEEGNMSLAVNVTGRVYGDRYLSSLNNRPLISNILIGSNLTVNYASMDLTTGVIGTEIDYINDLGEETTKFVSIDSSRTSIPDFLTGSTYAYRTVFIPEENAIDTFYTDYKEQTPIPTPVLKNAAIPFEASTRDGRWGILAEPWVTNDAILVHNGLGGWDEWNGNIFNTESGWGAPDIINGKIYQTVEVAQPATFVLHVNLRDNNHEIKEDEGAYFVVTKGEGIPDFENIETAPEVLAYKSIEGSINDYRFEFTTDEPDQLISVGFLTVQKGNHFANIRSWEILPSN